MVRFDRSIIGQPRTLVTGGADGCIRVWDVDALYHKVVFNIFYFIRLSLRSCCSKDCICEFYDSGGISHIEL